MGDSKTNSPNQAGFGIDIFAWGFPSCSVIKQRLPMQEDKRYGFDPCMGKIPRSRKWQPTPVFLPGKFHGQRSLAGYNPQGRKESDMTTHTAHTRGRAIYGTEAFTRGAVQYKERKPLALLVLRI